ncbi:MAG: TIGR02147 family protein [Chitinivibrionales bacterium]|nr:TIGR02147 family protein [Chitinivibrionales bacterium]
MRQAQDTCRIRFYIEQEASYSMKRLLEYSDYRSYLADVIADRKQNGLPASNRWFAMKMGINSNAWLTYILQESRNLNAKTAEKLSDILKHTPVEKRFFEILVRYNQAKSLDDRNHWFREMSSIRIAHNIKTLSGDQYDYYSTWYHSVIRSLIDLYPEFQDFTDLARQLSPRITVAETKKSVQLLEKSGLIQKDEKGRYRISDKAITSGPHEKALPIANYQRETMRLAQEALDRYDKSARDITTMTLGISKNGYSRICELLKETRQKIVEIAADDNQADQVYQLNMQLFPFSKTISHKDPSL